MKFLKKIGGWLLAFVFSLWAIVPKALDWIGRTTLPEDWEQLMAEKLPAWAAWLFSTPWWVPALLAAALTAWMMWISWPRKADGPDTGSDSIEPPQWQPQILIENINIGDQEHTRDAAVRDHSKITTLEQTHMVAYAHWNNRSLAISKSFNITSITDNGIGDFTFIFERPLNADTLVVLPVGETPAFKVVGASADAVRVQFDEEPPVVKIRFDSVGADAIRTLPQDSANKINIIDEALEILGFEGKLYRAIQDSRSLRAAWEQELRQGRQQEFFLSLAAYREKFLKTMNNIKYVHDKSEKYEDIQKLLAGTDLITRWQGSEYVYSFSEFADMMKRLGPNPAPNHVQLFAPYVEKLRQATNNLETWRQKTSEALITLRRQISG